MMLVRGEALGVVTNWPPSLEAALQRWGTISPKAPCLTSLDTAGKPLYVLTYGRDRQATPLSCLATPVSPTLPVCIVSPPSDGSLNTRSSQSNNLLQRHQVTLTSCLISAVTCFRVFIAKDNP